MEFVNFSIEIFLLLFLAGMLAGFVDSIAGGGGLIALPVLLFIGLPPQSALGTLKLQGSFGTFSASYNFFRKGHITLKEAVPGILFTLSGASCGALLVQMLNPDFLEPLIPVLLLGVFIYTLFSSKIGEQDCQAKMNSLLYYGIFGMALGFYDGFFGPGTGSFWTFSLMTLAGYNMVKAVGYTKIMNFTSNIVALIWFIAGGNVVYTIGLTMAAGQLIGARIGSNLAISNGKRIIKPLYLAVVFVTIVRLLYTNFISMT